MPSHQAEEYKNIPTEDRKYLSDINAAVMYGVPVRYHLLLIIIVSFIFVSYYWAKHAMLDEVTRGTGKVIPSSHIQTVQNFEGGILSEIYVEEGDLVEKGQVLLRLDNINFSSSLIENQLEYYELLASQARLLAEIEEHDIVMPDEILKNYPVLTERIVQLYQSRVAQQKTTIKILNQKVKQKQQAIVEQRVKIGHLSNGLKLIRKEIKLSAPLVAAGAISEVEILRLEGTENDLKGELDTAQYSIPRLESELQEAKEMISETRSKYRSEVLAEYNEVKVDLDQVSAIMVSMEDRVARTQIYSPVKGKIKQIKINTIGGVISPGMELIDIVPTEDRLLIEAQIRPSDIAFLHPGQKAMVKLTAYDFSIYGGLEANLIHISADTIYDAEKQQEFYLIRLVTEKNNIVRQGQSFDIIPGMIVDVDILTGWKTVLDYILKPILKTRDTAMRER